MIIETTTPVRTTNHKRQRSKAIIFKLHLQLSLCQRLGGMWPCKLPYRQLRSPAPGDQLQNQDDDGNNEQKVNQTARDVETEAKRPKDKKNNKNLPWARRTNQKNTASFIDFTLRLTGASFNSNGWGKRRR